MIIKDGGCASQPQPGQPQRKIPVRSGTVVRWVCGVVWYGYATASRTALGGRMESMESLEWPASAGWRCLRKERPEEGWRRRKPRAVEWACFKYSG